jgi:protein-tyrosine phosphatase
MSARTAKASDSLVSLDGTTSATARARATLALAYRVARSVPDRLLHGRRHLAARRQVSQLGRPRTILVLCHGNICRSPYLHGVLQRMLPDVAVSSAGFVGRNRPVPAASLEVSGGRGIDLSKFRSSLLTPTSVHQADLIIVMDPDQAAYVERAYRVKRKRIVIAGDLDPAAATTRAIKDPWRHPRHVFESSFDRLDRVAQTLVSAVNSEIA